MDTLHAEQLPNAVLAVDPGAGPSGSYDATAPGRLGRTTSARIRDTRSFFGEALVRYSRVVSACASWAQALASFHYRILN